MLAKDLQQKGTQRITRKEGTRIIRRGLIQYVIHNSLANADREIMGLVSWLGSHVRDRFSQVLSARHIGVVVGFRSSSKPKSEKATRVSPASAQGCRACRGVHRNPGESQAYQHLVSGFLMRL